MIHALEEGDKPRARRDKEEIGFAGEGWQRLEDHGIWIYTFKSRGKLAMELGKCSGQKVHPEYKYRKHRASEKLV